MAKGTICTYTQNKLGLITYYDKQWMLLDGIYTEPIEYHVLEEEYCGWIGKQLFTHKPPVRAVLQIIHNWLVGLHKGRQDIIDFQRPDGFSGPLLSAFQLTCLIQLMDIYILVIFSDRAQLGSHRLCSNGLLFDGLSGFFVCEVSDFAVQRRPQQEAKRPIWKTFAPRAAYDSVLVSKQALSKGGEESFHDRLVLVNLCAPTKNVCCEFFHLIGDSTH